VIDVVRLRHELDALTLDEIKDDYIATVISYQEAWQRVLKEARKYGEEEMFGIYPISLFVVISEAMDVLGE
jgi:hypothetical protein